MMEAQQPDWERLAGSDTWKRDVQPLLTQLEAQAIEVLRDAQKTSTIEQVRFLQGKAAAYHELLTEPEKRARLERMRREREGEEREQDGPYGSERAQPDAGGRAGTRSEPWISRVGRKLSARSR